MIVDIHCHTFNADDIPVLGFIGMVFGPHSAAGDLVGHLLENQLRDRAPGAEELDRLNDVLQGTTLDLRTLAPPTDLEAETNALLQELQQTRPDLVDAAEREAGESSGPVIPGQTLGFENPVSASRRYLRWALLFTKSRYELSQTVATRFPAVKLFIPLSVDFPHLADGGSTDGNRRQTAVVDQLAMQSAISRIYMRDHDGPQFHPFVGFDPRRPEALANAQLAIHEYGFVGVKMYPTMGFLPIGADRAERKVLGELYEWCCTEDIPITAHCNPSFGTKEHRKYSSPCEWAKVLRQWPDLHVNLGHGGWGSPEWPAQIARLMAVFPHLYADVGNHQVDEIDDTIAALKKLYGPDSTKTLADRLMFGTDWYMLAQHKHFEDFFDEYSKQYDKAFPPFKDTFLGEAALAFLGFSDPTNKNNQRVRARYHKDATWMPDWLATADPRF